MNPAALLYALQLLQALPTLISTGQNVLGIIQQGQEAIQKMIAENRNPSDEEWAALDAVTKALRDKLHEPE